MATKLIDQRVEELFEKLNGEVITIAWKWQILQSLFETQERVDLLTATAPTFFQVCQTTFVDDIFLMLARITDTPQSRGRDNLVITRLIDGVDQQQEPAFYQQLRKVTDDVLLSCDPFNKHRHKRLAHNDLNTRVQPTAILLPRITVNQITKAIDALQKLLNLFNHHYFDRETVYTMMGSRGVKALVTYLQKGLDAFRAEDEHRLGQHGLTHI